jgi:alpha-tubulin suppressor-like RCC1 family protein
MAKEKAVKRPRFRVTDIDDPLPDATFGSIGRYVQVAYPGKLDEPLVPQRLTLGFGEKQARHVDPWTLMLFRVELESCTFTPVESSRVDVDKRQVTAWVSRSGIYGLIGLPKHKAVLETLRLLDRFGPQLLEERERGERGLHERICGLILCADPTLWGGGPPGPGNLCTKCLGLDISFDRLPERYLLGRRIPLVFKEVGEEPPDAPSLLAWGRNEWGDLGDDSRDTRNTPVWVAPTLKARKILGGGHDSTGAWTLALDTDGKVWSWGYVVGTGVTSGLTPVRVGSLTGIVDIAAGTEHGLAVRFDGSVWSWGWSSATLTHDPSPVRVAGLSNIVAVAAGNFFSLALRNDGTVFAWGDNTFGQLGDESRRFQGNPVQVSRLTDARSIAAGEVSSFAVRSDGSVVAWGRGGGRLGDGTVIDRIWPVPLPGLADVEQIGVSRHGLARTAAGVVWFWGNAFHGESGDGTRGGVYLRPVRVPGLPRIEDIAVGGTHNLALQSNGTVWAWGSGAYGELGVEPAVSIQDTPIAVPLPGGRQATSIGAGWWSSFAIVS